MKVLSRLLLAPTLAAVLVLACTPTNAAHRGGGSAYDGTWSVAIYTLRGDCGSVRVAARIVGGRVYSEDQSYQANGGVGANGVIRGSLLALVDPHRAPAGYRTIPAQDDGDRQGENARVVGQPRDARAIRINRDPAVPRQGRNWCLD
jgi:hypothetical protein